MPASVQRSPNHLWECSLLQRRPLQSGLRYADPRCLQANWQALKGKIRQHMACLMLYTAVVHPSNSRPPSDGKLGKDTVRLVSCFCTYLMLASLRTLHSSLSGYSPPRLLLLPTTFTVTYVTPLCVHLQPTMSACTQRWHPAGE